jgi:hypothetical protein
MFSDVKDMEYRKYSFHDSPARHSSDKTRDLFRRVRNEGRIRDMKTYTTRRTNFILNA